MTTRIGDTIYFIGQSRKSPIALYKIENFQVKEIEGQGVKAVLNEESLTDVGSSGYVFGVDVIVINNIPMVRIIILDSSQTFNTSIVYIPEMDTWWTLTTDGTTFPYPQYQIASGFWANGFAKYYILSKTSNSGTAVHIWQSDQTQSTSNTATIYTDVLDLGTNRWKHIARVDAVGDYGDNVIALYLNDTPNYKL